jgi:DNA-binding transcriptional ArsR family regulator
MYDIHLTPNDIARVTVMPTYGPLTEVVYSLAAIGKPWKDLAYGAWSRDLSAPAMRVARTLAISCPSPIDLISLVGPRATLAAGVESLLLAPPAAVRAEVNGAVVAPRWVHELPVSVDVRRQVGRGLQTYFERALSPHWARILAHLDARAAAYARTLARAGVHALLRSVHPDIRWAPPTLTVDRPGAGGEVLAQGRGLVIAPVVFARRVGVFHSAVRLDEPIFLAVPAVQSLMDAQRIWGSTRSTTSRALAALLGETRSAALDAIGDGCTTSELARRLEISAATASHHATVLRSAGLVATQRVGSAVLHTLTPLGAQLLDGCGRGDSNPYVLSDTRT